MHKIADLQSCICASTHTIQPQLCMNYRLIKWATRGQVVRDASRRIPSDGDRKRRNERRVRMRQQLSNFKAEFFKALAHPLRISVLDALREGELTVNEISQRFAVEPANASQQLAVLRNRNIVVTRKEGANVYYSVSDKSIFKLLDAAKEIFNHHLIGVRSMLEEIHATPPAKAVRR